MRFFIDTEFSEGPGYVNLISIGIVAESGGEYYGESKDYNPYLLNPWVKENVLPHLNPRPQRLNRPALRKDVEQFIKSFEGRPEFWGYYCSYDFVCFAQLFGHLLALPEGWPKYCNDIKTLMKMADAHFELPPKPERHHALDDAKWTKLSYGMVLEYIRQKDKVF